MAKKSKKANAVKRATSTTNNNKSTAATAHADATDFERQLDKHLADFEKLVSQKEPASAQTQASPESSKAATAPATTDGVIPSTVKKKKKKKKKKSKKGSEILLPKTSNDDVDFESATATATEPDDVSDGENPDESNGMDMKDPFGVAPSGEHSPPKAFGGHAASPEVARAKSTPPPSPPPTRKLPMTPAEHSSFEESSRADVVDDDVAAAESALSATDVLAKAVKSLPDQTDSKEGTHDGAKAEADAEHGDKPSPLPSKLPIHTSRLSSESVPEILGSLRLTVISAENVPKKVLGKRDTFVICLVNGQEKLRTAVCKKSEKPVWSGATARCVVDDVHPSATLRFQLWEHDSTTTNNLIGDVTFDSMEAIADLPDADTVHEVLVRRRRTKGTKPIRMKLRIHYVTPAERRQSLLRRESSRSLSLHELSPPTEKLPAPPVAQMKTEQPASQRKSNPERRPAAKQAQVTEEQNPQGRSSATKPSIEVPPRGGAVDETVVLPSLGQSPGGSPMEEGNAEEDPTVMWRKRLAELTTVAPTANSSSTVVDVNGRFGDDDAVAEETPSVRPSSQLLSNLTSQLHDITSDFDALEAHAELDLDDSLSESARNVYINAPPRRGPITPVLSSPRYQTSGYEKLHLLEPQPAVLSPRDKRLEKPRFKVLESVNGLDLTGMGIRTLQKVALSTSLLSLKASSNLLGKIEFLPKSLTELDLSNNKITTITGLQEVRNLKVLSLCGNSISRLHGLKNNLKLEELFIANNVVKEVKYLEPLKELKILDLENNLLEGISSCALLSRNHKLEHLCVEGNPLAEIPEYRFELKKILPRAKWIDGKRVEVKRSKSPTPTSESVHHPKPWGWSTDQTKESTERLRAAKRRSQSPDKFAEMQWMRNRPSPPAAPWSPSAAERLIMEQARKDAIVAQQHKQQQERQRRSVVVRGDVTSPLRTAQLISQSPTKSPTSPVARSTESRKSADVPTAFASPTRSPDSSVVAVSLRSSHASIRGNHTVMSPTSPPAVSTASPPLSASTRTSASVVTVSPATTAASHSASSPSTRRGIASKASPAKGLQDSSLSSRNRAAKSPPQRQISHGPKPKVVSIDLSPSYTTHGVKGVVTRQRTSGGSSGWFGAAEVSLSDGREGYDDASLSIASISEIPESMSLELSHTENPTQSVNQPQVLSLSEALSLKDAMMQGQNGGGQRHNHHPVEEEDSGSETQVTFSESERDETEESALDTIRRELDDHDNSQFLRDEAGSSSAAGDGAVNGSGGGEKGRDKQLANIAKKFEDDLILELSQRRLEDRLAAVLEKAAGNFPPSPAGAQTRHGDRNYDDKAHAMSKLKRDLERVKGRIQSNTS